MSDAASRQPLPIAVLISGGGTTLKNLIDCRDRGAISLDFRLVISSAPQARGLEFARQAGIPHRIIERRHYGDGGSFSQANFAAIRDSGAAYVVMAGYLKHLPIPPDFENRVTNIHPSLVPAFCGDGMYGLRVHSAVLDYGAKLSGCTVHFVDNHYDHGPIIAQRAVPVLDDDTPESLAARVFTAECDLYPEVLRWLQAGRVEAHGRRVRVTM